MTVGIIQSWYAAGQSNMSSPTLSSSPASGNLLICWLFHDGNSANSIYVNTVGGWNVADSGVASHGTEGQMNMALCYRYADGNKVLTQVVSGNYSGTAEIVGVEIRSVYPTWAGNLVDLKHNFGNAANQFDTISTSSGGLTFIGHGYRDATLFPPAPSFTAGWTVNTGNAGLNQNVYVRNKTNGFTATVSYGTQGISDYIAVVLGDPPPPNDQVRGFPGSTFNRLFPVNTARAFPIT